MTRLNDPAGNVALPSTLRIVALSSATPRPVLLLVGVAELRRLRHHDPRQRAVDSGFQVPAVVVTTPFWYSAVFSPKYQTFPPCPARTSPSSSRRASRSA